LVSHISFRAGKTHPDIIFDLDPLLKIKPVMFQVHRNCNYKGVDGNSTLHITEVHHLTLNSLDLSGAGILTHRHRVDKAANMDGLSTWYEASVSSHFADGMFKKNEYMDLGEVAAWTVPQMKAAGVQESIYLTACQMIKMMDGVGLQNRNGVVPPQADTEAIVGTEAMDDSGGSNFGEWREGFW